MKILQGVSKEVLDKIKGKASVLQTQSNEPVIRVESGVNTKAEQTGYKQEQDQSEEVKKSR